MPGDDRREPGAVVRAMSKGGGDVGARIGLTATWEWRSALWSGADLEQRVLTNDAPVA